MSIVSLMNKNLRMLKNPPGPSMAFARQTKPIPAGQMNNLPQRASGQVLGASTGPSVGSVGQNSSGTPQVSYNDIFEQAPDQGGFDFDAMIAPALQGLDEAAGAAEGMYNTDIAGIDSARDRQIRDTRTNIASQEGTLEKNRTREQTESQSAMDQARRQFSEVQQGLQARYGATTGTGAFAGELAGRESMQQIGGIRSALSTAMRDIDDKLVQVKEIGRIAEIDINDKTEQMKRQAKSELDATLADIRRQRGELQSRKQEMAFQAMQLYQSTVNQVNARNAALKQQIYFQQQQAEQQLKQSLQRGTQISNSFTPQSYIDMVTNLSTALPKGTRTTFTGSLEGGGKLSTGIGYEEEDDEFDI